MKERPILFSGSMVRAILDGRKTQTRRIANGVVEIPGPYSVEAWERGEMPRCHYGSPGDRLWVRETWRYHDWTEEGEPWIQYAADDATAGPLTVSDDWTDRVTAAWESLSAPENFAIDAAARDRKWRPSIFMPRWASRLTLDVTAVRVERLQAISEADARAEGVEPYTPPHGFISPDQRVPGVGFDDARLGDQPHRLPFAHLWDSINGDRASWESNPWVWVVEFARAEVRK